MHCCLTYGVLIRKILLRVVDKLQDPYIACAHDQLPTHVLKLFIINSMNVFITEGWYGLY